MSLSDTYVFDPPARNCRPSKIDSMAVAYSNNWVLILLIVVILLLAAGWWWYVSQANARTLSYGGGFSSYTSGAARSKASSDVALSVSNSLGGLGSFFDLFGRARAVTNLRSINGLKDASTLVTSITVPTNVPSQTGGNNANTTYLSWNVAPVTPNDTWTGSFAFYKDDAGASVLEATAYSINNNNGSATVTDKTSPTYLLLSFTGIAPVYAQLQDVIEAKVAVPTSSAFQKISPVIVSTFSTSSGPFVASTDNVSIAVSLNVDNYPDITAAFLQVVDGSGNNLLTTASAPNGINVVGSPYSISTTATGNNAYVDITSQVSGGTPAVVLTNITQASYFFLTVFTASSQVQSYFALYSNPTVTYSTILGQTPATAAPYPLVPVGANWELDLSSVSFPQATNGSAYIQVFDSTNKQINTGQNSGNGATINTIITTSASVATPLTLSIDPIVLDTALSGTQLVTIAIYYEFTQGGNSYTQLTNSTQVQLIGYPSVTAPTNIQMYYQSILSSNFNTGTPSAITLQNSSSAQAFYSQNVPSLFLYLTGWTPTSSTSGLSLQPNVSVTISYGLVAETNILATNATPRTYTFDYLPSTIVTNYGYEGMYQGSPIASAVLTSSDTILALPAYFVANSTVRYHFIPVYNLAIGSNSLATQLYLNQNGTTYTTLGNDILADPAYITQWPAGTSSFVEPLPVSANSAQLSATNVTLSTLTFNTSAGAPNSVALTIDGFAGVYGLLLKFLSAGSPTLIGDQVDLTYRVLSQTNSNLTTGNTSIDITDEISAWVAANNIGQQGSISYLAEFTFYNTLTDPADPSSTAAVALSDAEQTIVSFTMTFGSGPSVSITASATVPS